MGAFTTALEHVAFAAQSSPKTNLAAAATGYVVQEYTDGTSNSGPVTCFAVNGTMAFISFLVKNGPDKGQYRSFIVVDGGQPVMGVPTDSYSDCGNQTNNCFTNNCYPQTLLRGNIVVSSGS